KKKKKMMDKSTPPLNPETDGDLREVFREVFQNREKPQPPPPAPQTANRKNQPARPAFSSARSGRREFQSSMDLVTNFEGESSLKGAIFSSGLFENQQEMKRIETLHPILEQLRGETGQAEIRKAIIYSEILKRKY
ncbi:MAG: hypothetical protein Q4G48_10265, partial [Bacteroidia bacterium]|nr:hypothetical protein [Bacteroidia bacterium]